MARRRQVPAVDAELALGQLVPIDRMQDGPPDARVAERLALGAAQRQQADPQAVGGARLEVAERRP